MVEESARDRWGDAGSPYQTLLACNRLLLSVATFFACIALVLSGVLGFLLGREAGRQERAGKGCSNGCRLQNTEAQGVPEIRQHPEQHPEVGQEERQDSVTQDPSENVLQPRLGSKDILAGPGIAHHVKDLDSARQASVTKDGSDGEQLLALSGISEQDGSPQNKSFKSAAEALQMVHANYISRWHEDEVPWDKPGRGSRLGSRVQSYNSETETQGTLTCQSSMNLEWRHTGVAPDMGSLLLPDWEIAASQIKFCYTPKGELISLGSKKEESQVNLYKAVLDGGLNVAVKTVKLSRDVFPQDKMIKLVKQQLCLSDAQQLLRFYGVCRTEDTVMLVYEYVEGGNMRDALRRSPSLLSWYRNGKVVARDVAQGLAFLHKHQMEHRSFRSSCVLVRASDHSAKIANAGLQAITRYCHQSRTHRLASSFEWAAPELLLGERCGPEADIFAFGIVLWELITQELPIRGALRELRVPLECPGPIKTLVSRCMCRVPEDRPTAEEIVTVIQRAWSMTPEGYGKFEEPPHAIRSRRRNLLPSKSQTYTAKDLGDERGMRDSVSEMVDIRRGVPVRRGTLLSIQSAGGATSSPSRYPSHKERIGQWNSGKPPMSPQSSPEAHRRSSPMSPLSRRYSSLGKSPAPQTLTAPYQRFMSVKEPDESDKGARLAQLRLAYERKRRSKALKAVHSAPEAERMKEADKQEGYGQGASKARVKPPTPAQQLATKETASSDILPSLAQNLQPAAQLVASGVESSDRASTSLAKSVPLPLPRTDYPSREGPAAGLILPFGSLVSTRGGHPLEFVSEALEKERDTVQFPSDTTDDGCAFPTSVATEQLRAVVSSSKVAERAFEGEPNPFQLARDGLSWDAPPSSSKIPVQTPTFPLASASEALAVSHDSKSQNLQPNTPISSLERWRQKCDVTFNQWLGIEVPLADSQMKRSSLTSHVGSFARLSSFRKSSPLPLTNHGDKLYIRSEEILPPTPRGGSDAGN